MALGDIVVVECYQVWWCCRESGTEIYSCQGMQSHAILLRAIQVFSIGNTKCHVGCCSAVTEVKGMIIKLLDLPAWHTSTQTISPL